MSFVALISNFFSASAAFFGYAKQRDAEKNAPDVKAAAIAVQTQAVSSGLDKTIANKDTKAIEDAISE